MVDSWDREFSQEEIIALAVQAGVNIKYESPPGNGKSAFGLSLKKALKERVHDVHFMISSTRQNTDFSGMPRDEGEWVSLKPVGAAYKIIMEHANDLSKKVVIFLDEIGDTDRRIQAGCLRFINERYWGDCPLPENVTFILAGNPMDCSTNPEPLAPAMANRMGHLKWVTDVKKILNGMEHGFPPLSLPLIPPDWRNNIPSVRSHVVSFLRFSPQDLFDMPKDEQHRSGPWPSPRTWYSLLVPMLAAGVSLGRRLDKQLILDLAPVFVGPGAGIKYANWADMKDLPDPEEMLTQPDKFKPPVEADRLHACLASMVFTLNQKLTQPRFNAAWRCLARVCAQKQNGVAAIYAHSIFSNEKTKKLDLPDDILKLEELFEIIEAARRGE